MIKNKVVFVCEPDTNIDALVVRYGAMALIKKTFDEIVIVVDIDFILKNNEVIYSVEGGKLFKLIAPEGTIIEIRDNKSI